MLPHILHSLPRKVQAVAEESGTPVRQKRLFIFAHIVRNIGQKWALVCPDACYEVIVKLLETGQDIVIGSSLRPCRHREACVKGLDGNLPWLQEELDGAVVEAGYEGHVYSLWRNALEDEAFVLDRCGVYRNL